MIALLLDDIMAMLVASNAEPTGVGVDVNDSTVTLHSFMIECRGDDDAFPVVLALTIFLADAVSMLPTRVVTSSLGALG